MSGHHHSEHKGDTPLTQLMVTVSGASGAEHESEPPGVTAASVKAGHEPDQFDVRPILYVPLLVVVVLLVAYGIVSGVFFNIKDPAANPNANPVYVEKNSLDSGKRFSVVSSSDPNAEVKQPRLEYFKKQQTKNGEPGEPEYYRSRLAAPEGNTPEITPQDLRAERYIDPTTGRKLLVEYAWTDAGKKTARLPIDVAMDQLVAAKKLPTRKEPVQPNDGTANKSKLSNAGRGGLSQPAAPAKAKPQH